MKTRKISEMNFAEDSLHQQSSFSQQQNQQKQQNSSHSPRLSPQLSSSPQLAPQQQNSSPSSSSQQLSPQLSPSPQIYISASNSSKTSKFISIATQEAEKSDMKIKHGSALVAGGKVIARGHNHLRETIQGKLRHSNIKSLYTKHANQPIASIHAEMDCLLTALSTTQYFKPCLLPRSKVS